MKTKHYLVENLEEKEPEDVDKFKKYLEDIENIFPIIEEVFDQKWRDKCIHIELSNSAGYKCFNNIHIARIDFQDDIIQEKNYPENLWGCLLHETLHAFINPIIHRKNDDAEYDNDLDEYYWDKYQEEPFIYAFQAMVYLRLKEKNKINEDLYRIFLGRLEGGLENSRKLYDRYVKMFSKNPLNFSKFIKRLDSSNISLFRKDTFWQDLDKAEEALHKDK